MTSFGATPWSIPTSVLARPRSGPLHPGGIPSGRVAPDVRPQSVELGGSKRFAPEPGGQGCAVGKLGDASIGVFTVANPLGAIFADDGRLLRGFMDRQTGERRSLEYIIEHHPEEVGLVQNSTGGHTTITAVIVDKRIAPADLRQFGRQIHTSMAQVIWPFHTPLDGDVLFSISVGEEPLRFPAAVAAEFGSHLAHQAIYSAVLS